MTDTTAKLYELVEKIENLCRERGELSLAEVEKMAQEQELRASVVLEELSIGEGITVDLAGGKVVCR